MEQLILAAILLLALFIIPLGLPGTWLMVMAAFGYELLVPAGGVGAVTVVGTALIALVAEVIEFTLSARYTRKYGGSRRAGWGAIIGGMIGAFMGFPVPIVGPIIGAFVGAFIGAFAGEITHGTGGGAATRVAWGALVGRAVAAAAKVAMGVVIAAWIMVSAFT